MDIINGLLVAITPLNLLYCFAGVFLGTAIGVLPGLGPVAALSILLPFTFNLGDPISSIIMLAGIYYGVQYGGSTSAILFNMPGEPASAVTAIDGYKMAANGLAGTALTISAIGSFIAGILSIVLIIFLAKPLATVALLFGPTEYASLMFMSFIMAAYLSNNKFLISFGLILLGVLLGIIGMDINSGISRFNFGLPSLTDGISFAIVAMGLFGLSEILHNIFNTKQNNSVIKLDSIYPKFNTIKHSLPSIFRGTFVGSLFGLIPGNSSIMASYASYALEKRVSKNPEEFGKGKLEGVAGPESANNAAAQTNFIPLLSLGLPITPTMALLVAVLSMQNMIFGPQVIDSNPTLFWGLIASMIVGNIFLLILNLPLIRIWVYFLSIRKYILNTVVLTMCIIGAYYISQDWAHVLLLIPFTLLGYILKKVEVDSTPLALGFVIGPLFEEYLRRSLTLHSGNWLVFLQKPISLVFITVSLLIFVSLFYKKRKI